MAKVDIIWSPNHDDKFVTFGSELSLYKVDTIREGVPRQQAIKLSDCTYANLLSTNTDNAFIKCLAWYPYAEPDHLLAVGLANGRVMLSSFGKGGSSDPNGLLGKEFMPKHARQCNHLAWNPSEGNLLAEALDKYRADYSILVWDVHSKATTDTGSIDRRHSQSVENQVPVVKPFVELGPSEATLSLSWFSHEPKTLVAGMNHKYLRIYDLRDISRPTNVAITKAVYGLCVDPHFEHRLASFFEGHVSVWDTRNFDKPVLTLQDARQVVKVSWSPTRSGLLGVLHRDSPIVRLYDIQNTPVGTDELEPAVIERIVQPCKQNIISSFDWHHRHENRMLAVTANSAVIKDVRVFERIPLAWSPGVHLSWACGRQLYQKNSVKLSRDAGQDISVKMKRRAKRGYGLQAQLQHNVPMVADDPTLRKLWIWLESSKLNSGGVTGMEIAEISSSRPGSRRPSISVGSLAGYCLGVKSVLTSSDINSSTDSLQWQSVNSTTFQAAGKSVYVCPERTHALQLCGWCSVHDTAALEKTITSLESEGDFERAAAISVFSLQLSRAIETLNHGAKSRKVQSGDMNLSMVAMALAGYTDERQTLWHHMCSGKSQITNPYLSAIFKFLTTQPSNYSTMLTECGMEVSDCVAFACIYLPDNELLQYIATLTTKLVSGGNLDGIILTGLSNDGLQLLAQYVDNTADVQTAALVSLQGYCCTGMEVEKDARVQHWIDSYRLLLDTWKLWHQRAEFDIYLTTCQSSKRVPQSPVSPYQPETASKPMPQVYVSCNYCSKSVANSMQANRNRQYMFWGSTPAHRPKVTSCPGCRKPLPRCSLCLINMGTPAGNGEVMKRGDGQKLSNVNEWFTWCQSCRHGGHAHHISDWFSEHVECPVTGCTCKCMSLDSMGHVSTNNEPLSPGDMSSV